MYKIMIADDEPIVLDGIKFLIEDIYEDMEIVGTVQSGREAIELANRVTPDIVLMDIKMPGINGIEAIEAIKERHQDTKFIIISAYEQFDFAKQAVELGVSDYLLKPVNADKLITVIDKVRSELDIQWHKKLTEIKNKEKFDKVIPILEYGFIYSLLLNIDYRNELHHYQSLFEISKEKGYVMVLELSDLPNSVDNKIGSGFKGQSHYKAIADIFKYKCKCLIGPLIINKMTVVVFPEQYGSEYEQRVQALELGKSIVLKVNRLEDLHGRIGIGSCTELHKIQHSMEEANMVLNQLTLDEVVHVNDYQDHTTREDAYTFMDIKADQGLIVKLVEGSDEHLLVGHINDYLTRIIAKFDCDRSPIEAAVLELIIMTLNIAHKHNLSEEEAGYSTYFKEIKEIDQIESMRTWCIKKCLNVMRHITNKKHTHISKIVLQAIDLINEDYSREITLVDMAKEVAVSPQYFSKIFKEEIGVSYIEYIRNKRIDVAKDLLRAKDLSVKEICYQIGYNDPNYFSRVFKKMVGVSPTDFQ